MNFSEKPRASQVDTEVVRRLTNYYLLALTAVALLSLAGQILIQYSLNELLDDARVINIAGRQRMLSQQLTKRAILLSHPDISVPNTGYYFQDFAALLNTWATCHFGLKNGLLPQDKTTLTVRLSDSTARMFQRLDPHFRAMYGSFRRIQQNFARGQTAGTEQALRVILAHERDFLQRMDAIVFQFDRETKERVDRVKNIEFMLGVITFIVLFLEGLFIFRPVVARTGQIIQRFIGSERQLQRANEQLTLANQSLRQAQEALLHTAGEKHQLERAEVKIRSASLLEGQEDERRRLARELHDGIGQMLTGLKLNVEQLKGTTFTEKQQRTYDELQRLLNETIEGTRVVSYNLMPSVLSDFGLAAALRLLTEQAARSSGVVVEYQGPASLRLPGPVETSLYRIAQEALHNALKHAQAAQIVVTLERKNGTLTVLIEDDGRGFDVRKSRGKEQQSSSGGGLGNMRTRTELLNGSLKISSEPGRGTRIFAKFPL
ncbi:MAG: histidine kinase [Cytophagaceae bacterium]|nr:histidine kinase [Cytophagaceae bacterium]